jgi:hypothetical protein
MARRTVVRRRQSGARCLERSLVPSELLSVGISVWLAALGGLIASLILNGSIRTNGLLATQLGGAPSPERIQLLVASLIGAGTYASSALSSTATETGMDALPEVPEWLLTAMVGSQAVFLGSKLMRRISGGEI